MISFRYHVASLLAVLLALAAGVALGAGSFDDGSAASSKEGATSTGDTSTQTSDGDPMADQLISSLTASLVGGQLGGTTVALVVLPGAPGEAVAALTRLLETAGATITSVTTISPDLVDLGNKQLVEELGSQLEQSTKRVAIAPGAGGYDRIGSLLGYAIAAKTKAGAPIDSAGKSVLAGLSAASLLRTGDNPVRRADLVLVVTGAPQGSSAEAAGVSGVVLSLLSSMQHRAGGLVLAGPLSAAGQDGALAAVRTDTSASTQISTVDSVDDPAGQIVAVLALAEQAAGKHGHYGVGAGASGPRPGVESTD